MSIMIKEPITPARTQFLKETLIGLSASPKFMHSKYFYDERGDYIFQQIMEMDEYYLTKAEMDILLKQSGHISKVLMESGSPFDIIELGAGDATKSIHLLKELLSRNADFRYLPIDISAHVIADLEEKLPAMLPGLKINGLNGDYLDMLQQVSKTSERRKVILFMGANIGNMNASEAEAFCAELRTQMSKDDLLIIGFDLKKSPRQILAAYNDAHGITSTFNLNLLRRINEELDAEFDLSNFEHYASYDPESGSCKSYLISLKDQVVSIGDSANISFSKNEYIFMEISQKYDLNEIDQMATSTGFRLQGNFFDQNAYFVDSIWQVQ